MYRSVPKDFIIPVRFMREDEQDLFDFRSDISEVKPIDIKKIETEAQKLINASLSSAFSTLSKLNRAQLEDIILSTAEEFMQFHLDNVKCLKKISTNGFNGMSIDQILNMHLNTVRDLFNFHFNGYSCGKYTAKGLRRDVYNEFKAGFLDTVKGLLEKLDGATAGITREQMEEIDKSILSDVFNWLIKNVPCFKGVTQEVAAQKLMDHIKKFKEVFTEHLADLGCK